MAALLHVDVLRQHLLSPFNSADLGSVVPSAPTVARLRPVASWRIGSNGRPVCHWTVSGVRTRVPPD